MTDGTKICRTCRWAKDNNLPGWKLCTFPLPEKPTLPYWALQNDRYDMWEAGLPVDVEDDDTDCATWEARG